MKKISLILAISASFIVGTLVAGNLVFAAPADSQNELLSAILQEVQALTGLVEDQVPETTKRVVSVKSGINPTLNCPDGSNISGLTTLSFRMDEFGDIPVKKGIGAQGGTLFELLLYDINIDENSFEVRGIGEVSGGPPKCGLAFSTFTFSISGQCSDNTQIDMATSSGMTISTTGSVSCLVQNPDVLNPDILN